MRRRCQRPPGRSRSSVSRRERRRRRQYRQELGPHGRAILAFEGAPHEPRPDRRWRRPPPPGGRRQDRLRPERRREGRPVARTQDRAREAVARPQARRWVRSSGCSLLAAHARRRAARPSPAGGSMLPRAPSRSIGGCGATRAGGARAERPRSGPETDSESGARRAQGRGVAGAACSPPSERPSRATRARSGRIRGHRELMRWANYSPDPVDTG